MTGVGDTRDRLIALETDVKHLTLAVDELSVSVKELTALLQQAKGARWLVVGAVALGGFLSGKIATLMPWLLNGPKV